MSALSKGLQLIKERVANVQLVWKFDYQHPEPFEEDDRPEFIYHIMTKNLARKYFADSPQLIATFCKRINEQSVGELVTCGDDWASYVWLRTPNAPPPAGLPANVSGKYYWLYDSFTNPNYRGKGLYKKAMAFLINWVIEHEEHPLIYAIIHPTNIPPRRALRSLRFLPCGVMTIYYFWIPKLFRRMWFAVWRRSADHERLIKDEDR